MNISSNGSTSSIAQNTTTTTPASNSAQVINILNYVDISARVFALLAHVGYVAITITHKELRSKTLLFMHNANFIGLVWAIMYAAWINTTVPNIPDPFWYRFVCSIAEAAWVIIKYSRAYSILVLGIFRFIAVYYINMYKRLSQSLIAMIVGCILPWLAGSIVFIIAKYAAHTTYAPVLCSDGYTTILADSILYYLLTTILGYLVPIFFVCLLFVIVNNKINEMSSKLKKRKLKSVHPNGSHAVEISQITKQRTSQLRGKIDENIERISTQHPKSGVSTTNFNAELSQKKKANKNERTLAFQFMTINTLELISAIALACININLFIPTFNTTYYYMRQLFRIVSNIAHGFIPIISIVFHPFKLKLVYTSK